MAPIAAEHLWPAAMNRYPRNSETQKSGVNQPRSEPKIPGESQVKMAENNTGRKTGHPVRRFRAVLLLAGLGVVVAAGAADMGWGIGVASFW
ncbi:hypothetical protein [Kitasatospora sp. NPDC085879]|uniref:hypothetical protein n=1 Tax=Kitasatospora sp. NPDC085879 TaxID=3154769 RepID=UPI003422D59C